MQNDAAATRQRLFVYAALLQFVCGAAFLIDALSEVGINTHFFVEMIAVAALWTGAVVTIRGYAGVMRRNEAVEKQLDIATGAFQTVLETHFRDWGLTPSEADVALLSIKGLSIAKIAEMRNTREGTVKAQNAAVYRKAGVSSRAELLSLFIEEIAAGIPEHRA